MFVTKSLPQLVGSLMIKAEIPFHFLPRLLGLGYMFFDFEVRNTKSWKGKVNDQLNKVLEFVKSFPCVTFVCKLPRSVSPLFDGCGVGERAKGPFFAYFGGGCEEAPLTRRLPLFFTSYYHVSLLSANLMFLAKFRIAKKFSCTSLLSKQELTFKRFSVASTKLEIHRISSI